MFRAAVDCLGTRCAQHTNLSNRPSLDSTLLTGQNKSCWSKTSPAVQQTMMNVLRRQSPPGSSGSDSDIRCDIDVVSKGVDAPCTAAVPLAPATRAHKAPSARRGRAPGFAPSPEELEQLITAVDAALPGGREQVHRQLVSGGEEGVTQTQLRRCARPSPYGMQAPCQLGPLPRRLLRCTSGQHPCSSVAQKQASRPLPDLAPAAPTSPFLPHSRAFVPSLDATGPGFCPWAPRPFNTPAPCPPTVLRPRPSPQVAACPRLGPSQGGARPGSTRGVARGVRPRRPHSGG
jgi:hypothetical protein